MPERKAKVSRKIHAAREAMARINGVPSRWWLPLCGASHGAALDLDGERVDCARCLAQRKKVKRGKV